MGKKRTKEQKTNCSRKKMMTEYKRFATIEGLSVAYFPNTAKYASGSIYRNIRIPSLDKPEHHSAILKKPRDDVWNDKRNIKFQSNITKKKRLLTSFFSYKMNVFLTVTQNI
eukprot:TRINITY_DN19814_c1_g1_i1.p2 TRINITY_DN19814_c1_g1~~TRINITY_DN19814_c1_g1_i1.p2  ORF type:complete len:112 (-),score=6.17 TRINITY_DN19814_c1_g1_i1:27-362(-)